METRKILEKWVYVTPLVVNHVEIIMQAVRQICRGSWEVSVLEHIWESTCLGIISM